MALTCAAWVYTVGAGVPSMSTRVPTRELSIRPPGVRRNCALSTGPSPRPKKEMISPGARGVARRLAALTSDVIFGIGMTIGVAAAGETARVAPATTDVPIDPP